jgi:heme exporter protein C
MQWKDIEQYASPNYFMQFSGRILPWLVGLMAVLLLVGLYMAFFVAPPDYQQGQTVKIMFIHVPTAWLGMMGYMVIAVSSVGSLVWRHPMADVSAKSAAPIGAAFTLCALLTGSLWGKPMWGTYWVWDARLTSMLVLLFLYLGLMALWQAIEDRSLAGRAAAILALVGAVNIPIIKFSVNWWNTLHQPASVGKIGAPSIHSSILIPLIIMAIAFTCMFFVLHFWAMRNEILRRRVTAMQVSHAGGGNV